MMPMKGVRTRALVEFAERRVSLAFEIRLLSEVPVDLFRLAETRRIHSVEFRPLLADGCLIATAEGFCVQINDRDREVVAVGAGSEARTLGVKQRFTLAHEIAHTLTYEVKRTPPCERRELIDLIDAAGGRAGSQNIEAFCQIVGGMILVPAFTLKRMLGQFGKVDSMADVLTLARTFQVSPEVVMHRLSQIRRSEPLWPPYYSLLMVGNVGKDEQIRACLYSPELRGIADPPRLYSRLGTWIKRTLIPKEVLRAESGAWESPLRTGCLHVAKKPYRQTAYFLEIRFDPA